MAMSDLGMLRAFLGVNDSVQDQEEITQEEKDASIAKAKRLLAEMQTKKGVEGGKNFELFVSAVQGADISFEAARGVFSLTNKASRDSALKDREDFERLFGLTGMDVIEIKRERYKEAAIDDLAVLRTAIGGASRDQRINLFRAFRDHAYQGAKLDIRNEEHCAVLGTTVEEVQALCQSSLGRPNPF
jgi:hypothetical protein